MLSKRAKGYAEEDLPEEKRFRHNLSDLFLSNEISGTRAAELFRDAAAAGAANVRDLSRVGAAGRLRGNAARDLRRRLLKRSQWCNLYWTTIPSVDPKTGSIKEATLAMLLPHEIVFTLLQHNSLASLQTTTAMSLVTEDNLSKTAAEMGIPLTEVLALGLWGDGVASKWDRSESLEVVSLNLPGLGGTNNLRVPLCCISKRFVAKQQTMDSILSVVVWSLQACARGKFPSVRHDGSPWKKGEARRASMAGRSLGARPLLVEVRGDWAWYKQVLRLPGWRDRTGCCFLCSATPADMRDASSSAKWRGETLSHWELLLRMRTQHGSISPIWAAPGFRSRCICIDWMHTCDLGIACDFLGNLFWSALQTFPPGSLESRVAALFQEVQLFYQSTSCTARLDALSVNMIRPPGKSPKLRASAAEARALVPFGEALANKHFAGEGCFECTVRNAAKELHNCYRCLSKDTVNRDSLLPQSCKRFCLLYISLEALARDSGEDKSWVVKPKLHWFQELCERGSTANRPTATWNYRDEDFGGSVGGCRWAGQATRRLA